jgi:hypothetical protein
MVFHIAFGIKCATIDILEPTIATYMTKRASDVLAAFRALLGKVPNNVISILPVVVKR